MTAADKNSAAALLARAGSVKNHRAREKDNLVYPVYSRRSRGLSVGINLFPDKKSCSFDCPYCEVFPFANNSFFDKEAMEDALVSVLAKAKEENITVMDICFSGNGEPSLSVNFPQALEKVLFIQDKFVPCAEVVVITNGTGLLQKDIFDLLADKARAGLKIWLKVDAATVDWFTKINRPSNVDFFALLDRIRDFSAAAPFTVQTMICKVEDMIPPREEEQAWVKFVTELALSGKLRSVQIYGKARPAPEDPLAAAVDISILEDRAEALGTYFKAAGAVIPIEVFP